jgi:hypothetical protein
LSETWAQNCSQTLDFEFKTSAPNAGINWLQFPEFELPFKVVYGGSSRYANPNLMFKRGFTHLSNPNFLKQIPEKNRAFIYYGVSTSNPPQPWMFFKSPFLNDLAVQERQWSQDVNRMIEETGGGDRIAADIFVFDIETQLKSDDSILVLKNTNLVSEELKKLSNQQFIEQYKRGIQDLYGKAMKYTIEKGKINTANISSYSDAPILNTFINIQGRSWNSWKTDKTAINYVCYDFDKNQVGGVPYNTQSFITPSAYFYYDYPHPFASEYLSYLLFQIEANRAWSNKDQMVFVWGKYSFNKDFVLKNIKPWMAESMAIFPFFAGAKGIWLWDDPTQTEADMSNYEIFTKGLYRLSKFKSVFEGDYKLIENISARDYNENKLPIWRGVLNGNKLLIAAQNPNAKSESEEVTVQINHENFNREIVLRGYEIFLCQYDLSLPNGTEPRTTFAKLKLFPNPTSELLNIRFELERPSELVLNISDLSGRILHSESINEVKTSFEKTINVRDFVCNEVLVTLQNGEEMISQKVILAK